MRKNKRKRRWVTKGILVSKRRVCFLNRIKRVNSLTPKALEYINNYQQIPAVQSFVEHIREALISSSMS
jgi:hypothetical protein